MQSLLGAIVLTAGAVFLALGGLGVWRMPDTWTRIQAGTKATTLGMILSMAGAAILMPGWTIKLVLIALFLMFTNPLSSQVLARAAHRAGVKPDPRTRFDALAADEEAKR
ncbi:multicomponent Na+:H+ antiporter subunit G [Rhodobacter aestuarii]|uniref:Multicomponent Na+:H+ antiporter subunit G n=1 Tax=Rhodobacter aestuarii TaxID=453582 RepID=A0A1N7M099_9RHOB|nr:monovalent cation/H(+) antiporter subunit G [Rhodobacter aestuarii]PTV94755.1 multicomponent Na+:H+ antiporter subunit G [Rhodobacter aestuarii]SIS79494.1 multicomponent Na+:H+ antiporter subunit G [Rhodobacter aestuarii]